MTYYEMLEVTETASAEMIHMAYKVLAKKYHPDLFSGDKTFVEEQMKQINTAYRILSDPSSRAQYDAYLRLERSEEQKAKKKKPKKEKKPPTFKRSVITVSILLLLIFTSCLQPYINAGDEINGFTFFFVAIDFVVVNLIMISIPLLICSFKESCSLDFICKVSRTNSIAWLLVSVALYGCNILDYVFLGGVGAVVYYFINKHIMFQMHQVIRNKKYRIFTTCAVLIFLLLSLCDNLLVLNTMQGPGYFVIQNGEIIRYK